MKKRIVFGLLIIVFIGFLWFFNQSVFAPAQIKSTNLEEFSPTDNQVKKSITIRISQNDQLFVNDVSSDLKELISKIDSLIDLGFNDSSVLIKNESGAKIETVVQVLDMMNAQNRKFVLVTKNN